MSGLLLAGGGHCHALMLRRWSMKPSRRPSGLITLVSRSSTALYSGMVPGLIAGIYDRDQVSVNLRDLADQAGVALVVAEITGLNLERQLLRLKQRPALPFELLSLNLGAITKTTPAPAEGLVPIKPLEPALTYLADQDSRMIDPHFASTVFRVVGSGLAAVETALALRQRWPERPLLLQIRPGQVKPAVMSALRDAGIRVIDTASRPETDHSNASAGLLCTGSLAPDWLAESRLPCCPISGRVRTEATLQVIGQTNLFAAGDCAVIDSQPRPPSGVWAVRAATPLARNLEALAAGQLPKRWHFQGKALQLLGGFRHGSPTAWALRGNRILGPHPLLWRWKTAIDARFMAMFHHRRSMADAATMACRGCAAKLAATSLESALQEAGIAALANEPEDAAVVPVLTAGSGAALLQSVDGFPALVSDPWLNARITALHACSDLWACGARVLSAQAVVTLPETSSALQEMLLAQTLAGIRSALEPQDSQLIGGHTLEARDRSETAPLSLALQVSLSVNGQPDQDLWPKAGLQAGDRLLLSRPLGTGVLFAAAMAGATSAIAMDAALEQMATSQHPLLDKLLALQKDHPGSIHAATDITGFGLLGHLGEMVRRRALRVELDGMAIPSLHQALPLLETGYASSLAPANRRAWSLLDDGTVRVHRGDISPGSSRDQALLELLVDPQTCGPLLISVPAETAVQLSGDGTSPWTQIGQVHSR